MEIKREPLGDFRVRQLQSRDMLRGDLEGEALEQYVQERLITTTVEKAVSWARGNSFFPLTFGLACCAIEQIRPWARAWTWRVSAGRRSGAHRASPI